ATAFDDYAVARAVDELPRPRPDPTQDELWLAEGDQVFGTLVRADGRGVVLRGPFGRRTYAWPELRGVYLKAAERPLQKGKGEEVRVWRDSGVGAELDHLDGNVRSLDGKRLTLRHAVLGDVQLDRDRLRRLRWLAPGVDKN